MSMLKIAVVVGMSEFQVSKTFPAILNMCFCNRLIVEIKWLVSFFITIESHLCVMFAEQYTSHIFQHFVYCYWWRSPIFQCLQQESWTHGQEATCHLPVNFMWPLQGCCSNYTMLLASVLNNLFYFYALISVAVYASFEILQIFKNNDITRNTSRIHF